MVAFAAGVFGPEGFVEVNGQEAVSNGRVVEHGFAANGGLGVEFDFDGALSIGHVGDGAAAEVGGIAQHVLEFGGVFVAFSEAPFVEEEHDVAVLREGACEYGDGHSSSGHAQAGVFVKTPEGEQAFHNGGLCSERLRGRCPGGVPGVRCLRWPMCRDRIGRWLRESAVRMRVASW